jgi:GlpG protein
MSYQIWVYDEDRLAAAQKEFDRFAESPTDVIYDLPPPEVVTVSPDGAVAKENVEIRQKQTPLTTLILFLCASVFFLNLWEELPLYEEGLSEQTFLMTPIQATLLYDLPPAIEKLEEAIEKHRLQPGQKVDHLAPEIVADLKEAAETPSWKGIYSWVMLKWTGQDPAEAVGPLFRKIRQGEFWRLFSPAIVHVELLHILFNMLWVWVLSRMVEQKIGWPRLFVLSVLIGIFSNTAQYLMSGPFFIGYSGVVVGLAGFIWMREKIAPWEGYPLSRSTVLFLLIFILGVFGVQLVSFGLQLFTDVQFAPNIANTAHISGGLMGAFLGRLSFFREKVSR